MHMLLVLLLYVQGIQESVAGHEAMAFVLSIAHLPSAAAAKQAAAAAAAAEENEQQDGEPDSPPPSEAVQPDEQQG
jgi:hypothetical protein